jgi:hypothetical protein
MIAPGNTVVAKKKTEKKIKSEEKFLAVKIERAIVTRARVLAADRGETVADFLSGLLREPVDKEWSKMVRKASGGGD